MIERLRSGMAAWRSAFRRAAGSVRARILASYVILLLFASVASVLGVRAILFDRFQDRIEDTFVQEIREFQRLAGGRNPRSGLLFRGDLEAIFSIYFARNVPAEDEQVVTFLRGKPFRSSRTESTEYELVSDPELVERWGTLTEPERGEVDTPAGPARYAALPVKVAGEVKGTFVVATFTANQRAEVDDALQVAWLTAAAVLVIGTIIAFLATGRVLAPLGRLTETAREITESDLTGRIEVRGSDEISEQARTFNDMLDRIEAAFDSQRNLIRNVGHELRTPLTIARGNIELLDADDDPEERRETIELVTDELDRVSRLVDELLLLARSERPDFLELETVDLGALSDELLAKASMLASRDWRLESRGKGILMADRQRLTQAVVSLAQNAVQQTDPGERIELGTAREGRLARLWVRDHGSGVPLEEQERIFERFMRGRNGRRYEGSGLGLSIVTAIAEAHGGRVDLKSRLGEGAKFTIEIPAEPDDRSLDGQRSAKR